MLARRTAEPSGAMFPVAASALLVDDAGADRSTISQMMTAIGVKTVHQASSALEAFRVIRATAVDLLVVDVLMPNTDGLTFLRTVRSSPRFATVPAIIITASRDQAVFRDARAARADGYLLKPFTSGALLTMMQVALRGKSPLQRGGEPECETPDTSGSGRVSRLFRRF